MSNESLITGEAHLSALLNIMYSEEGKEKNSPPNEVKITYNDVVKSLST